MEIGFLKSRFLRTSLPANLLCRRCHRVLRGPMQCRECFLNFCSGEKVSKSCQHLFVEASKYLVDKINRLLLKCCNNGRGCTVVCELKDVGEHEETCPFQEEKTNSTILQSKSKSNTCPLELLEDGLICLSNKHSYDFEPATTDALNNAEKKVEGLKRENGQLQAELENKRREYEVQKREDKARLKVSHDANSLAKEQRETQRQYYIQLLTKLKSQTSSRLIVLNQNSIDRIRSLWNSIGLDYESLRGNLEFNSMNFVKNMDEISEKYGKVLQEMAVSKYTSKVRFQELDSSIRRNLYAKAVEFTPSKSSNLTASGFSPSSKKTIKKTSLL